MQRSYSKEIMDDLSCEGEVLLQALNELKTINKLLGGNKVTTDGLGKLINSPYNTPISIADIGCGGGDMIAVMQEWGNKKGASLRFEGVDANPNIIELAKKRTEKVPNVNWKAINVFDPRFLDDKVDVVCCTLFTHHFTDEELTKMFRIFRRKARLGIIVNDLHRHPLAYHSIKLLTFFFSKSEMVKNDAPLSVKRGFIREDWHRIGAEAGLPNLKVTWHWAFRWQVICALNG